MVNYSCERCGKIFSQKSNYVSHNRRKTPCENNNNKIKSHVDKVDEEKLEELNNVKMIVENEKVSNNIYTTIEQPKEIKYSELSRDLTRKINNNEKKKNGIYFTPPETICKNIEFLEPFIKNIKNILEPSCGSCEYILRLKNIKPNINITGIELNKTIFESIKQYNSDNITLLNDNYLSHNFDTKFDLIIGNPPYFVMKKSDVEKSYHNYFDGRPNIFILFIIKSLELLNNNGIISFILPKNFLNCLYYDKTRKHIIKNYNILNILDCDDKYIETQQNTIILIIQNEKPTNNNTSYSIIISGYTIFGTQDNIKSLKTLYTNSKTLIELGFNVSVGNIVWNQCKKELTDDNNKTHLIYSSDITNNKVSIKKYSNKEKKNYIDKKGNNTPLLVVNRGYGVGSYNFNYCIINENDNINYLVENHLICIKYTVSIPNEILINKYKQIIKSFINKKTTEFINLYFGNNAMNTTELCKILPIYDI
jgi:type I restriction-modification system DNA methylase subunit